MADRQKNKKKRRRLPGFLMTLAALGVLLSLGGPQGVAVNSPLEALPLAQLPAEAETAMETMSPMEAAEILLAVKAEGPLATAETAGSAEEASAEEDVLQAEEPARWTGPVPEGEAVEDTYFDDVVFLGNSRTDGLRLYGGMERGTFLCATGITVESVFTKPVETDWGNLPLLDALAEQEYGKIYVMLGINELGWAGTDIFREQGVKLIQRLQADHPEAEIIIQSILPVSRHQESKGTYVNNRRIAAYNEVWLELAQELGVAYLDVAEAVADENGCLPKGLTYDGVHLNTKGCLLWLDYLRTHPVPEAAETTL